MNKETPRSRPEELYALVVAILLEMLILPLKTFFYIEEAFSISRFLAYQCFAIFTSISLYFYWKKPKTRNDAEIPTFTEQKAPVRDEEEAIQSAETSDLLLSKEVLHDPQITEELETLRARLSLADETLNFLEERIAVLENENKAMEKRLEESTKETTHSRIKTESLFSLTRQLTKDLKLQAQLIEEERKKHALEMRTMVLRETKLHEKETAFLSRRNIPSEDRHHIVPQGTSTEAAISCLLSSCTEALHNRSKPCQDDEIEEGGTKSPARSSEWPSMSYPLLVRRKLYESILRLPGMNVGSASLKNPEVEITLSSRLMPMKSDIIAAIAEIQAHLDSLENLEPHYHTISDIPFIFFRCTEPEINDVIVFGISSSNTNSTLEAN